MRPDDEGVSRVRPSPLVVYASSETDSHSSVSREDVRMSSQLRGSRDARASAGR